jgi:uncharacterized protein
MRNGYLGIVRCLLLVAAAVAVFNLIGAVIMIAIYGLDVQHGDASVMVAINSISELIVLLAVPFFITRQSGKNPYAVFRLEGMHETPLAVQLIGVPMIILTEVLGGGLDGLWHSFLKLFPPVFDELVGLQRQLDDMMSTITNAHTSTELLILIFGISAVPAIAEEAFFRGFIQTHIERSGKGRPRPFIAIAITSILFGAMHMSPLNFPGLVSMGAMLGWLAYRTGDLRVSILAHAMNNGLIVLATYFFADNAITAESLATAKEVSITDSLALIALALPFLIAMLYVFQKLSDPLTARDNAYREIAHLNLQQAELLHTDATE